ncbi:BnaC06g24920D [Brassica napus]|uniref:(rape) hypothetical protein n=1 Tax=Brassica napus TaxID=3708 RepID=A0A078GG21_BRANA|nr:unnamed protein product [Brassica napus]CDY23523.1 BnaC06g24920D [Brassica napus]
MTKEEQEKELLKLGLPIVGGLSCEFSNVKKAASVDHATVDATCSGLEVRAKDARKLIAQYVMRSLQRRNIASSASPSRQRTGFKFPVLPPNFMSDRSWSDSGESDSDM